MAKDKVDKIEKYWTIGDGESGATRIFFSLEEALATGEEYIDAFDKDGIRINVYQMQEDKSYKTTDF